MGVKIFYNICKQQIKTRIFNVQMLFIIFVYCFKRGGLNIYYFGVVDCGIKWDLTFEYFENTQVNKGKLF